MTEVRKSTPHNYNQNQPPGNEQPSDPSQTPEPDDTQNQSDEQGESRLEKARKIISTVSLFLAAPIFALILILFVIQSYEVDGPSMQDTLHDKDLLIVDKLPKTWSRITRNPFIPERSEIVIFTKNEGLGERQLVKRVIALPGETVKIKDGQVRVYNSQNPGGFNPDVNPEYKDTARISNTQGNVDIRVPENHVFVMGDNRDNSLDSRSFGPVDVDEIVGVLGVRLFPLSDAKRF